MKMKNPMSIFFVLVIIASALMTPALNAESNETLIIGFKDEIPGWIRNDVLDVNKDLKCVLVKADAGRILKTGTNVRYVEKNKLVHALYVPNDSFYEKQWNLKRINMEKAWNLEKGSENVTLAILDTGINYQHEDLPYISGFDFVNNDSDPMDDNGHGTAVAGVAAAAIDNGKGIAGIANVSILALKVLNESGLGTTWNVSKAITYAANHSADVISMSFGGDRSGIMKDACSYAWNKSAILFAASGNENSSVIYPAAYTSVVAVGATDKSDEKANYSNFGPELEIVAPGNSIPTTSLDGYTYFSGTSASTPHASAVAALIKSRYPQLSNEDIRERLRNTAVDLGKEGKDDYYGYGLVNAYAALKSIFDTGSGTYPSIFGTHNGTITPNVTITVQKIYTYPCVGTGGHTEYVKIWNDSWNITATWEGYQSDWRNITLPEFELVRGETYNYTIQTGSYPQIIHKHTANTTRGAITCTSFVDANGKTHNNWIPAIRLL